MSPVVFVGVLVVSSAIAVFIWGMLGGGRTDPRISANLQRGLAAPVTADSEAEIHAGGSTTWLPR